MFGPSWGQVPPPPDAQPLCQLCHQAQPLIQSLAGCSLHAVLPGPPAQGAARNLLLLGGFTRGHSKLTT